MQLRQRHFPRDAKGVAGTQRGADSATSSKTKVSFFLMNHFPFVFEGIYSCLEKVCGIPVYNYPDQQPLGLSCMRGNLRPSSGDVASRAGKASSRQHKTNPSYLLIQV